MNKEIITLMIENIGYELNKNGFNLVDSTRKYAVYHRENNNYIEIIQWAKDKYFPA